MLRIIIHVYFFFFFFNKPATTEIYTLSPHDPLPNKKKKKKKNKKSKKNQKKKKKKQKKKDRKSKRQKSSHVAKSYADFCLKKKKKTTQQKNTTNTKQTLKLSTNIKNIYIHILSPLIHHSISNNINKNSHQHTGKQ